MRYLLAKVPNVVLIKHLIPEFHPPPWKVKYILEGLSFFTYSENGTYLGLEIESIINGGSISKVINVCLSPAFLYMWLLSYSAQCICLVRAPDLQGGKTEKNLGIIQILHLKIEL